MKHELSAPELGGLAEGRTALRVMLLCALVLVLEGYDIGAMGYAIPALSQAWHLRPVAFTAALTAGSIGLLAGSLLCGWLGDRIGRKSVLMGCVAMFGAMSLLTATVDAPMWLALVRFGTGIGLGGGIPSSITLLSDFSPPKRQGALVILMSCGVTMGNIVGGIIAALLIAPYGWKSIFVVGGAAPLVVLPLLVFLLPESAKFIALRHRAKEALGPSAPSPARVAGKNLVGQLFQAGFARLTVVLWVINFLSLLTIYFISSWLPSMLHAIGATAGNAIIAATMFHVGGIGGVIISGLIVGRFGVERVFSVLLAVSGVCILVIGLTDLAVFVIGCLVFASGIGISAGQFAINSLPGAIYPPMIRSTGTGWAIGVGRLGNVAGPLLGGVLLSLNWLPKHMFLALSAPTFSLALMLLILANIRASGRGLLATGAGATLHRLPNEC